MKQNENNMEKSASSTVNGQPATSRSLTADFYPDCWTDDERMDNLFAPFRVKSVNPVNYERKLDFWKNLIVKYCVRSGNAIVTVSQLKDAFKRGDKKPYCLDVVLKELVAAGAVQPKSSFALRPQETWSGWAVNTFIKSPLQWGYKKVKDRVVPSVDGINDFSNIEFVVLEVVEVNYAQSRESHYISEIKLYSI